MLKTITIRNYNGHSVTRITVDRFPWSTQLKIRMPIWFFFHPGIAGNIKINSCSTNWSKRKRKKKKFNWLIKFNILIPLEDHYHELIQNCYHLKWIEFLISIRYQLWYFASFGQVLSPTLSQLFWVFHDIGF